MIESPLTPAERQAFDSIAEDLRCEGVGAPEAYTGPTAAGFHLVASEADIPELPEGKAPAGFGIGDVIEARQALQAARNSGDVQRTLDAHHAWLDMAEEVPAAVQRSQADTRRLVLAGSVLGGLAGFASGFGLAALVIGLVR